jgi:hypothetical protein
MPKGKVDFNFENGNSLNARLAELPEEIVVQLALYGLSQKVGDSYSGVDGNIEEAEELANGVYDRLKKGEFKASRESSGSGRVSDLARALAQVAGVDLSAAVEKLAEMDKDAKKGLKENLHIQRALTEIQKAKLAEKEAKLAEEAKDMDVEDLGAMFS